MKCYEGPNNYFIAVLAIFSMILAPVILSTSVSAYKPRSFETCEKQVGNGGTTEGGCKQNNKNFEEGKCSEHDKGKSGNVDRTGQCI